MLAFPRDRVTRLPHYDRAKQIINNMYQRGSGWLQSGQFLQAMVLVLAPGVLDLRVERFLAWKMFVDERFRHTRRLGQLTGRRVGEAFPREQRQCRPDNGLPAFFGAKSLLDHDDKLVAAHQMSSDDKTTRRARSAKAFP